MRRIAALTILATLAITGCQAAQSSAPLPAPSVITSTTPCTTLFATCTVDTSTVDDRRTQVVDAYAEGYADGMTENDPQDVLDPEYMRGYTDGYLDTQASQDGRWTAQDREIWATRKALPACEYEDSTGCFWDASERGNGEGTSFVAVSQADGSDRLIYADGTVTVYPSS